jgi:hypothetical protein
MAYAASQPVKEVPGFARVGQAVRKGVLAALNPLFGTPENPTKLGRAMALAEEASQYGLSAGPAAAVGRMRFNPHPVRGPRIVDKRFLGSATVPLQNRQAASSVVAAPKSMFSNSPGNLILVTDDGRVLLPREADVKLYRSERVPLPNGQRIALSDIPAVASSIDAANAPLRVKQEAVRKLNDAANPYWMYWMYEKDVADLNATLQSHRAGRRFYDNANLKSYDVLAKGDAATVVGEPVGTKFMMRTRGLGDVTFSPNHASAMSRDRFVKDPRLYDVYNDGYLPYQSLTFLGAPYTVRGKPVTPVMRVTDHHEVMRDAAGKLLPGRELSQAEYRTYDRTYNIGRDIPYFGIKPVEPGGVDLMYHLDSGQNVVRANGAYSASVAVQQAGKGGDSRHRNFRNFLASDKVPESIFGYPVVQRTEDYTPEDVEFFKANPKAAGFYDLEDGSMVDEAAPQQAAKAKPTRKTYDTEVPTEREAEYQAWRRTLPELLQSEHDYDLRGYWLDPETIKTGIKDGTHFVDKYKKPNHPTFSVESKYAQGDDVRYAGKWNGSLFVMTPDVVSARAGHPDAEVRENLLREMWRRASSASGDAEGLGKVFYGMSGESALDQGNLPVQAIINGHKARLIVHANDTDRKRNNPANVSMKDSYTNLGTLTNTSHVFTRNVWGTGPGTNWYDTERSEPRFGVIARKEGTTRAALALMENGARFLNGSLSRHGIPSDARFYGDGTGGLTSDAVEIPAAELTIGVLPTRFKLGRKRKGK